MVHALSSLRSPPPSSAGSEPQSSRRGGASLLLVSAPAPLSAAAASPYGGGAPCQAYVPEARNLFPATPPPKGSGAGGSALSPSTPSFANTFSNTSDAALSVCLPLCSLMASWLRAAAGGNLGGLDSEPVAQV